MPYSDPKKNQACKDAWARTPRGLYNKLKQSAKHRGISVSLTFEQFAEATKHACTYCGGDLPVWGYGLDRVDNDLGYEASNVVSCCGTCNVIRGNSLTYDEMLVAMRSVVAYRNLRVAQRTEHGASTPGDVGSIPTAKANLS